jgi:cold shock CspA family protein
VARTFRGAGYGFLEAAEGREVDVHRNAVRGGSFESLEPGVPVRFVEEAGEKGPQATIGRSGGRRGRRRP